MWLLLKNLTVIFLVLSMGTSGTADKVFYEEPDMKACRVADIGVPGLYGYGQQITVDPDTALCTVTCANKVIRFNTLKCYYETDGKVFLRDLTTENTAIMENGSIRPASQAEILQMSMDVWNLLGLDIRRKNLISDDLSNGQVFGTSSFNWSPGIGDGTGETDDGSDDDEGSFSQDALPEDDDDNEAIPTPDPVVVPEPEVPIVIPIIESVSYIS